MVGKLGRGNAIFCRTFNRVVFWFGHKNGVLGQAWTLLGRSLDTFRTALLSAFHNTSHKQLQCKQAYERDGERKREREREREGERKRERERERERAREMKRERERERRM